MQEKLAEATTTASYSTSGGVGLLGLYTLNDWLILTSIIGIIATWILNAVYKHKHYKLEQEKLKLLGLDHDRRKGGS